MCAIDGCPERRSKREWCGTHYKRWTIHKDPLVDNRRVAQNCSVATCPRYVSSRGLCVTHADRFKRHGDVLEHIPIVPDGRRPPNYCREDGCDGLVAGRERCRKHYGQIYIREVEADPVRLARRKEVQRRLGKQWRAANPQRHFELQKMWRFNNPSRAREGDRRRYARLKAAPTTPFTYEQLMARMTYWGNQCWVCGGPFEAVDHVKPIAKGGSHMISNFRPICKADNSRKKDSWSGSFRTALRPIPLL